MVGRARPVPAAPTGSSSPLWVRFLVGVLGAVVILCGGLLLFRPPKATHFLTAADDARVRTLLRDYGDLDSLGYFATRRDKSVDLGHRRPRHGSGRGVLPPDRLGQPGQRQPDR